MVGGRCDTNKAADKGTTPICITCSEGHVDVVRLLVEAGGCNINKASEKGGTPLGAALVSGQDLCVELLLAAPGINVNCVPGSNSNALLSACSHIMGSLGQLGSSNSTRSFVRLLASRRVSSQTLAPAIESL